jgi:hypothetical protein
MVVPITAAVSYLLLGIGEWHEHTYSYTEVSGMSTHIVTLR